MPAVPNLKKLREAKLLTQEELAQKAGLSAITISRLENSASVPEFRTVKALAAALGVDPKELLGDE